MNRDAWTIKYDIRPCEESIPPVPGTTVPLGYIYKLLKHSFFCHIMNTCMCYILISILHYISDIPCKVGDHRLHLRIVVIVDIVQCASIVICIILVVVVIINFQ